MRLRFRLVAALLALLSLSFTVAEGVWASTCMPGMEMGTAPATMAAPDHGMAMPTPTDRAQLEGSGTDSRSPEAPHCPLAPTPGSCLALAVSIPAHAPKTFVPSPGGTPAVAPHDDAQRILLVSSFFRPPRA